VDSWHGDEEKRWSSIRRRGSRGVHEEKSDESMKKSRRMQMVINRYNICPVSCFFIQFSRLFTLA
jgi:hypothetical protein